MSQPFWDNPAGAFEQWLDDLGEASLWNTATLGGRQLPGVVRVDGAETSRKWDVKTAPGSDGATITDQGYEVAKPTLTLSIWTPTQWAIWQEIAQGLMPKPGKASKKPPAPVAVTHPALNHLGINNLIILSISAPKPASPKGVFEVTIKTVQWLPPRKAGVTTPRAPIDLDHQGSALPPPLPPTSPSKSGASGV